MTRSTTRGQIRWTNNRGPVKAGRQSRPVGAAHRARAATWHHVPLGEGPLGGPDERASRSARRGGKTDPAGPTGHRSRVGRGGLELRGVRNWRDQGPRLGPRWGRIRSEDHGQQRIATVSRPRRSAAVSKHSPRSTAYPDCLSHGGSQGFKSPHLHPTTDDQQNAGHRHIRGRPRPAYRRYVDLALCRGKQPGGPSSAAGPARLTAPAPRPAG